MSRNLENRKNLVQVQIMNIAGMDRKNVVNSLRPFIDGAIINNVFNDGIAFNNVFTG